ncbi:hypothetical protein D0X24_23850, partial [Salmonella enterica subsp. enterica serovar Kentucky]|nr:hypothetical protein [Salmonella enterica subsp. enterica serovar Kentucky]
NSGHYMGPSFSWGDFKINECAQEQFLGNSTNWVSIDTSHHMTYVLAEVKEFEKKIVEEKTREILI